MSTLTQEDDKELALEKVIRFRTDDALWERLWIFSIKSRQSIQAVCNKAITTFLDAQSQPNGVSHSKPGARVKRSGTDGTAVAIQALD